MNDLGSTPDFPWWRVLNNEGRITLDNPTVTPELQQKLLEEEGVVFGAPLVLDMERYRYRADKETLKKSGLTEEYAEEVFQKYAMRQSSLL